MSLRYTIARTIKEAQFWQLVLYTVKLVTTNTILGRPLLLGLPMKRYRLAQYCLNRAWSGFSNRSKGWHNLAAASLVPVVTDYGAIGVYSFPLNKALAPECALF